MATSSVTSKKIEVSRQTDMRLHMFGLANHPTRKDQTCEPFTPLVHGLCKMMHDRGETVIFYGAAGSNPPCTEFVEIVPKELLDAGLELETTGATKAAWRNYADSPTWLAFVENGRRELRDRYRTGDIALISFGRFQQFVTEEAELSCEALCGYSGIFHNHKVFPSHAWRSYLYGELKMENAPNWSDIVIPHYLDLDDFPVQTEKQDYLLFIGRLSAVKGPHIAIDIANRTKTKLIVCGVDQDTHGIPDWLPKSPYVEFAGYVNPERRLELLQGAKALLHPCAYWEPFGMVLIEALACGTPIIGSPFGALPEIIDQGVTGFVCLDMEEFVNAVQDVSDLDPMACRRAAEKNHSLEVAYHRYWKYFRHLQKLLGLGWYETRGTWRGPAIVERVTGGWGAEIGVDRGSLSSYLLREMPDLHLTMVDTWTVFPTDSEYTKSGDTITQQTQEQRDAAMQEALRVTPADRRLVLRMTSKEAAALTPNQSLDFVVLDADRSYEGISNDLRLWPPKVKPGGLVCVHDYAHPSFPSWGVKQAVDEFAEKNGKTVELGADFTCFVRM
jgi:hypothetical protein